MTRLFPDIKIDVQNADNRVVFVGRCLLVDEIVFIMLKTIKIKILILN